MRKILFIILALTLVFAVGASASAPDTPETHNVTIETSVEQAFTIVIPATTTELTWGTTTAQPFGTVGLTTARLTPGKQITITLSGNDGLANLTDSTKRIAYAIKDGTADFTSASFTDTTHNKTLTILVEQVAWDAAPAGSYSDAVTFTATVTSVS